jgi:hypothetical protein
LNPLKHPTEYHKRPCKHFKKTWRPARRISLEDKKKKAHMMINKFIVQFAARKFQRKPSYKDAITIVLGTTSGSKQKINLIKRYQNLKRK